MAQSHTSWADIVDEDDVDNSASSNAPISPEQLTSKTEVSVELIESTNQPVEQSQVVEQDNKNVSGKRETKQKKKQKKQVTEQVAKQVQDMSRSSELPQPQEVDTITSTTETTIWQTGPLYADVVAQNLKRESEVEALASPAQVDKPQNIVTEIEPAVLEIVPDMEPSACTVPVGEVQSEVPPTISTTPEDTPQRKPSKKTKKGKPSKNQSDVPQSESIVESVVKVSSVHVEEGTTDDTESESLKVSTKEDVQSQGDDIARAKKTKKKQKKKPLKHASSDESADVEIDSKPAVQPAAVVPLSESPKEIAHLLEHVHENVELVEPIANEVSVSDVDHEKHVKFSVDVEILKEVPLSESPKEIEHLLEHHAHKPSPLVEQEVVAPIVHEDDNHKHVQFVDEISVVPTVPLSESVKELEYLNSTTQIIEKVQEEQEQALENEAGDDNSEKRVKFDSQVEILPTVPFSESSKEIEKDICLGMDGANTLSELVSTTVRDTNLMKIEVVELVGSPNPVASDDDKRVKFDPMVEVLHNVPFSESVKETSSIGTEKQDQTEEEPSLAESPEDSPLPERRVSFSETVVKIQLERDDDEDGFEVIDMAEVEEVAIVAPDTSESREELFSQGPMSQTDISVPMVAAPTEIEKDLTSEPSIAQKESLSQGPEPQDTSSIPIVSISEKVGEDVKLEPSENQEELLSQDPQDSQAISTVPMVAIPKEIEKNTSKKQKKSKKKSKQIDTRTPSQEVSDPESTLVMSEIDTVSHSPRAGLLYAQVVAQKPEKDEQSRLKAQITDYDTETIVREDYVVVQEISITQEPDPRELEVTQTVQAEMVLKPDPSPYESSEVTEVYVEQKIVLPKTEQLANEAVTSQISPDASTIGEQEWEKDVRESDLQFVLPPTKTSENVAIENDQLRNVPVEKVSVESDTTEQPTDNPEEPLSMQGLYCIWQDRSWLDRSLYGQAEERYAAMAKPRNAIDNDQQHDVAEHAVPSDVNTTPPLPPPTVTAAATAATNNVLTPMPHIPCEELSLQQTVANISDVPMIPSIPVSEPDSTPTPPIPDSPQQSSLSFDPSLGSTDSVELSKQNVAECTDSKQVTLYFVDVVIVIV
uniref:Uncharacterized protein n=1 Tax=Anopheles maculatus TaxID=74869 RepID=A0A182SZQ6_9DIPT